MVYREYNWVILFVDEQWFQRKANSENSKKLHCVLTTNETSYFELPNKREKQISMFFAQRCRSKGAGGRVGGTIAPPVFARSVNPIPTRALQGGDYTPPPHICWEYFLLHSFSKTQFTFIYLSDVSFLVISTYTITNDRQNSPIRPYLDLNLY